MIHPPLTFLKLGGSLITDKNSPLTPKPDVIKRVCVEISRAINETPDLPLVLGHGSGSFGHAIASQHQTQSGGQGGSYWHGFAQVWQAARQLNQIVVDNLTQTGLPVIAFPPSASVLTKDQRLISWDTNPLQTALSHGLIPLVQGDVVFDTDLGGTIVSTEQVFQHLAKTLHPAHILLAGLDAGVYRNPETSEDIIRHITPSNYQEIFPVLSGAKAKDVTGGMLAKVRYMLTLVSEHPTLEVHIFSGAEPGNIYQALMGQKLGTRISC